MKSGEVSIPGSIQNQTRHDPERPVPLIIPWEAWLHYSPPEVPPILKYSDFVIASALICFQAS